MSDLRQAIDRILRKLDRRDLQRERDKEEVQALEDRVKELEQQVKWILKWGVTGRPLSPRAEPAVVSMVAVDPRSS